MEFKVFHLTFVRAGFTWNFSTTLQQVFHTHAMRTLLLSLVVTLTWSGCQAPELDLLHIELPCSVRSLDVLGPGHVRFAGSNGWVGQTQDGGATWEMAQWMAPDSTHPSFRASGHSADHWHAVGIASPAWIARASKTSMTPEWTYHNPDSAMFLDAMVWLDGHRGFVFGDATSGCFTLLATHDSGMHWKRMPCGSLPAPQEGEAAFAASNGNLACHGDTVWIFTGGLTSRCLRSVDAGKSWTSIELPVTQGSSMTGVFSATFRNAREGWAMGGNWEVPEDNEGNLAATTDGGTTWKTMADGQGPGYRSSIVHHPTQTGALVATGFDGLDVSLDGGQSWAHHSDSSHYVARFSPDGRILWLAGAERMTRMNWPLQ